MRIPAVLFSCITALAGSAQAQPVFEQVDEQTGIFAGAQNVSAAAQPDHLAALEQQSLREFRYEVLVDSFVRADLTDATVSPAEAGLSPKLVMLISKDGERFQPVESTGPYSAGSVFSVLLRQATTTGDDGAVTFHPAAWTMSLTAASVDGTSAQANVLPLGGRPLGCTSTGCGEGIVGAQGPNIAGEPGEEEEQTIDGELVEQAPLKRDDLAAELQKELARVGCYTGAIDGLWGPASRAAIAAFNTAADADLAATPPSPASLVAVARAPAPVCQ